MLVRKDRVSVLTGRVVVVRRGLAALLVVSSVALVSAASAVAEPNGIFGIFRQCPTRVPGVGPCAFDRLTSGEFVIGGTRIPIEKPLTLQMGFIPTGNPEYEREFFGVPAKDGETLSKTELKAPVDLFGAGVRAIPELVLSDGHPVIFNEYKLAAQEGEGLVLLLRFHLENPFVGVSCYIGSEANPLQLGLTTGETHPPPGVEALHGVMGTTAGVFENEKGMTRIAGASLVDNTFSMPGAEGCGGPSSGGSLDARVDEDLHIPNKAGQNAAVLYGEISMTSHTTVIASESWTVAPALALPVPGGLPASNVTKVSATLNGSLNPGGAPDDYHFEYGTTTAYGSFEPIPENHTPSTGETLTVSQPIVGLQAGTTYHYRLVADNPEGLRVVGPDETFTTLPMLAPTMETSFTNSAGILTTTPGSPIAPPAATSPASSNAPLAHHTLHSHRRVKRHESVKKHRSTKKQGRHVGNTNARGRKKHASSRKRHHPTQ